MTGTCDTVFKMPWYWTDLLLLIEISIQGILHNYNVLDARDCSIQLYSDFCMPR